MRDYQKQLGKLREDAAMRQLTRARPDAWFAVIDPEGVAFEYPVQATTPMTNGNKKAR